MTTTKRMNVVKKDKVGRSVIKDGSVKVLENHKPKINFDLNEEKSNTHFLKIRYDKQRASRYKAKEEK